MKKYFFTISLIIFCANLIAQPYHYPYTKTVDVSDNYFGTVINDPYRWLENIKDTEVVNWFQQQANYTNSVLDNISGTKTLLEELTALSKVDSKNYSPVTVVHNTYYFLKKEPGEQVEKLYYRKGEDGKDVLLFDPSNYIAGKVFDMHPYVNTDGSYLLLNLSEKGKEISDVYIMDLSSHKISPVVIQNANATFSNRNPKVVFYSQQKNKDVHDTLNTQDIKFMMHVIGSQISADRVVLSRQHDPEIGFKSSDNPAIMDYPQSPYMFAKKGNVGARDELFFAPVSALGSAKIPWKPFCKYADEIIQMQGGGSILESEVIHGNTAYCISTKGNKWGKILKVDLLNPDLSKAPVIIAGSDGWNIDAINESNHFLIIMMNKNELEFKNMKYDFVSGKIEELKLPLIGTIFIWPVSPLSDECHVANGSWTKPFNFYQYNALTGQLSKGPFYVPVQYPGSKNIISREIEVTSYDGVEVPLSIIYDSTKLKRDGNNICCIKGYGAYGFSFPPVFNYKLLPLLKRGVIIAIAHVRGGGEKGEAWHLDGYKTTKPNTWKDFNACAEYLVKNNYTSSPKLGCTGASAGGILIGRAITDRPDLYQVAIPMVGCLNTLRLENTPNGPVNVPEFGTVKDSVECAALIEMDALHHLQKGTNYPAMLITTGFNDPRVESWIPGKFAAAVQADNAGDKPVLLYLNYEGGHFGGSTENEMLQESAMESAFLLWQCGDPEFRLKK